MIALLLIVFGIIWAISVHRKLSKTVKNTEKILKLLQKSGESE